MAAKKKATKKPSKTSSKARATSAAIKRSKAAKKGWATRRRNAVKKKISSTKKKLSVAKKFAPDFEVPKVTTKGKTKKQLEEDNRALEARLKHFEMTEDWVSAVDPEYMSRYGHIAISYSRARHNDDYHVMRARLEIAEEEDQYAFDHEVREIAAEYGYEVREIYSLWFSP